MANNTDFLTLYAELGLHGDYTFVDFRRAYRHRVAELHPDRVDSTDTLAHLQQLNAQYAAVTEFWRRHGRMPGAVAASRPPTPRVFDSPAIRRSMLATRRSGRRRWHLWSAALVISFGLAWWQAPTDNVNEAARQGLGDTPSAIPMLRSHRVPLIELGSTESAVQAIQGLPITMNKNLWEYGPSWIAFRCHVVSDWYSSPLHPLLVATMNPPPPTDPPKRRKGVCLDPADVDT